MPTLPTEILAVLMPFSSLFTAPTFAHLQFLFIGAIITPGGRTVASCLRSIGLEQESHFTNFHRVLNRASWSPREGARLLCRILVQVFVPTGPILLGLDDTIERRRGEKIKARGIYRDPVRSSHGHFVKCSGLRWLSLMVLAPIPFADRVWALPFFTLLCPSVRYFEQHRVPRAPKKLTEWARQLLLQIRRWLPDRELIVVADAGFAVLELLARVTKAHRGWAPLTMITRLRLDAALFEPAPPRKIGQKGRPRKRGLRLPTLAQRLQAKTTRWERITVPHWYGTESGVTHGVTHGRGKCGARCGEREVEVATGTAVWSNSGKAVVPIRWVLLRDPQGHFQPQALLCTYLEMESLQIVSYFVRRWQVEVTFHEVREHLGLETQRQWSDRAIARTTPLLLGLFSLVTLAAHRLFDSHSPVVSRCHGRRSAWYDKTQPTFVDALAWVRRAAWFERQKGFLTSDFASEPRKTNLGQQLKLIDTMTNLLCYAA